MRRGAARPVALAAALCLVLSASPALSGSASGCEPTYDSDLGWVCPEPGFGLRVLLPGGGSLLTHGSDPPVDATTLAPGYGRVTLRKPACVTQPDEQFHGRVLYVYPSDAKNRVSTMAPRLREMYSVINGIIRAEAAEFNRRVDLRVLCSRGDVFVQSVQLPTPEAQTDFSSVVSDMYDLGYHDPLVKYYIWFDGAPGGRQRGGGTANVAARDDRLTVDSRHARGPNFAVTWGSDPEDSPGTMLHEIAHTHGAVSADAPNGTGPSNGRGGGFHCNDGSDIMCYPDNAARTNYKSNVCSEMHFDCNHNDYFNPKPKKGTWIAEHWNLGGPANRFMSGCMYRTAYLAAVTGPGPDVDVEQTLADAGLGADPIGARTYSIKKSCRGRSFALSSYNVEVLRAAHTLLGPLGLAFLDISLDPGLGIAREVDVCFYQGSTLLTCASEFGSAIGKLPSKANKARIFLLSGANTRFVFNVV